MLALIMVLSLAACGTSANQSQTSTAENGTASVENNTVSSESNSTTSQESNIIGIEEPTDNAPTQENEKRYIGETDFLIPDEVTEVKSTGSEIVESIEEDGQFYDYKVVLTYISIEDAVSAYEQYINAYIGSEFPDRQDSKGYIIRFKNNPEVNGTNTWSICINEKRYIGETEFLTPDDVTVRSKKSEIVQLTEDSQRIDYKIVFTYASASSVDRAYNDYKNYLNREFPDLKDSKGFIIGLGLSYESSTLSVYIEREQEKPVITDEMLKDIVGKYREIKNPGWSDDTIEQMWQERSWYSWLDIAEDGTVRLYMYSNGEVTQTDYEDKCKRLSQDGCVQKRGCDRLQRKLRKAR